MKVNFNIPFMGPNGDPAKDQKGKIVIIKDWLSDQLFNGATVKRDDRGRPTDTQDMIKAHALWLKISSSAGPIDITSEEGVLCEKAMESSAPGLYGQVFALIEGK